MTHRHRTTTRAVGVLAASAMAAGLALVSAAPASAGPYSYKAAPKCYKDCANVDYYNNALNRMRPDANTGGNGTLALKATILGVFQPYIATGQDDMDYGRHGVNAVLASGYSWKSNRSRCFRKATADFLHVETDQKRIRDNMIRTFDWAGKAVRGGGAPGQVVDAYMRIGASGVSSAYQVNMGRAVHDAGFTLFNCQTINS